jgi:hypothetical protein
MRNTLFIALLTVVVASGCNKGSGGGSGGIRGQVLDPNGTPVEGAIVKVKYQNPQDGSWISSTMTDREGKFKVDAGRASSKSPVDVHVVKLGFRKYIYSVQNPEHAEPTVTLEPIRP